MTRILATIILIGFTTWVSANQHWPEWFQLANKYYQSNQYDSAYANYFNVVHYSNTPDSIKAVGHKRSGIILYQQEQYEKSIESFKLASKYFKKINDLESQHKCWSNIANVYVKLKEYKRAKELYLLRLSQAKEALDVTAELSTLINLGGLYNLTTQYELAAQYYHKAKELAIVQNDTLKMKIVLHNLSTLYLNQFKADSALLYLNKTSVYSKSIILREATLWNLQELYYQLGNTDSAYKYLLKFQQANDSLKSEKIALTIARLETELELQKSKAKYATVLNWVFGLGAALIVGLFFWLFEKRSANRRLKESQGLTNMFIKQLKAFENEKSEVGSLLHSDILPTLSSVVMLIDLGKAESGRKHLAEAKDKLYDVYNNQFYSRRFADKDWLIYTPTNAKHDSKLVEVQYDHDPKVFTNEFQIAVLSILEQLLQDGGQKLHVYPDDYGVEVNFNSPIHFSKTTKALLSFFDCAVQETKLHIPILENRL